MEQPAALAHLLAWPRNLEHFTFDRMYWNESTWDFGTFETLLKPYRSTLKSISIGYLTGGQQTIDFSCFTELSTLSLSRWQLYCTPEVASSTLLAPKLHTFIWDFGIYDQHTESLSDFAQAQVDWILKFAELAAGKGSCLRNIKIVFNPDPWNEPSTRLESEERRHPWNLMDDLNATLKLLGIELTYSPIPFSCLEEIEETDEEDEESLGTEEQDEGMEIYYGADIRNYFPKLSNIA
jgi:hypothetical protein